MKLLGYILQLIVVLLVVFGIVRSNAIGRSQNALGDGNVDFEETMSNYASGSAFQMTKMQNDNLNPPLRLEEPTYRNPDNDSLRDDQTATTSTRPKALNALEIVPDLQKDAKKMLELVVPGERMADLGIVSNFIEHIPEYAQKNPNATKSLEDTKSNLNFVMKLIEHLPQIIKKAENSTNRATASSPPKALESTTVTTEPNVLEVIPSVAEATTPIPKQVIPKTTKKPGTYDFFLIESRVTYDSHPCLTRRWRKMNRCPVYLVHPKFSIFRRMIFDTRNQFIDFGFDLFEDNTNNPITFNQIEDFFQDIMDGPESLGRRLAVWEKGMLYLFQQYSDDYFWRNRNAYDKSRVLTIKSHMASYFSAVEDLFSLQFQYLDPDIHKRLFFILEEHMKLAFELFQKYENTDFDLETAQTSRFDYFFESFCDPATNTKLEFHSFDYARKAELNSRFETCKRKTTDLFSKYLSSRNSDQNQGNENRFLIEMDENFADGIRSFVESHCHQAPDTNGEDCVENLNQPSVCPGTRMHSNVKEDMNTVKVVFVNSPPNSYHTTFSPVFFVPG